MADKEDNPITSSPGFSDLILDMVVFSISPWKWAVLKIFSTYGRQALTAAGIAVPLIAGVTPTISQQIARKPDEHLSSETQPSTVVHEGSSQYVVSTTTGTGEAGVIIKPWNISLSQLVILL